jgi:hypothetical protein
MLRIEVPLEKPFPEIRERLFASLKSRAASRDSGSSLTLHKIRDTKYEFRITPHERFRDIETMFSSLPSKAKSQRRNIRIMA